MDKGFITPLVIFAVTALSTFAVGMSLHNLEAPEELKVSGDPFIFTSAQVGTNPANGDILTTNGTESDWVTPASLGLGAGSGGGSGLFEYTSATDTISPIIASTSPFARLTVDSIHATSTATSSTFAGGIIGDLTGDVTGNADTATALAANGSNCSAGNFPLGVDENGAVESCTDAWTEAENTSAGYISDLSGFDTGDLTEGSNLYYTDERVSSYLISSTTFEATIDHGGLAGLSDDDHPQYGILADAETISGNWDNTSNPWADNEVADALTISSSGSVDWTALTSYPTGCTNQFVRSIGDTLTCATVANTDLANSSVSYGGVSVSLGGSDATPAFDLTDATSLPISTGVSGLGSGVATFLATPSSANFFTAVTGETGSGAVVGGTSPVFTTNIDIGTAGVRISDDGDGALTFLGLGNGSDENLIVNFDDTANEIDFTSGTGVGLLDFNTLNVETDRLQGNGDTDTYVTFPAADQMTLTAGGVNFISIVEGATDVATLLGEWDLGGATSFELVNGANPTVNAAGELAFNTSLTSFSIATSTGSGTTAELPIYDISRFAYASSSWTGTSTRVGNVTTPNFNERVTTGTCYADGTGLIRIGDGTNFSNAVSLSSGTTTVTFTSNNYFNKNGERWVYQIGTPSSLSEVQCSFELRYER